MNPHWIQHAHAGENIVFFRLNCAGIEPLAPIC